MRKADRLFQIIQILRRSTRPVTAAALAEELEVSKRTVYRDIADLVGQRVPVTGEAGFGYLLDADYDMPPLMLTPDEIEAVVLGAQWVAGHSDALMANAARDVIAKIASAIPDHLRPYIEEPSMGVRPVLHPPADSINMADIRKAIRQRRKLALRYRAENGAVTDRIAWPVLLGYAESHRLLVAWCELRQDFRHFRCDRITKATPCDDTIGLRRGELRRRWQRWRAEQLKLFQDRSRPPEARKFITD